jgi:predicted nucleic acid-binding protein
MSWLIDTNVLTELRKGVRANPGARAWFAGAAEEESFTSFGVGC